MGSGRLFKILKIKVGINFSGNCPGPKLLQQFDMTASIL